MNVIVHIIRKGFIIFHQNVVAYNCFSILADIMIRSSFSTPRIQSPTTIKCIKSHERTPGYKLNESTLNTAI